MDTANLGQGSEATLSSGALVVEHRSQRADNLHKFSLRLEDRTNVLVRTGCLVPEFACQPVVVPDSLHLTPEFTVAELVPRRAPAQGSARAVSARTERLFAPASLHMEAGAAHRPWQDSGLSLLSGHCALAMHPQLALAMTLKRDMIVIDGDHRF